MSFRNLTPILEIYSDIYTEAEEAPAVDAEPATAPEEPADEFSVESEILASPKFHMACVDLAKTLVENYSNFFTTGDMDDITVEALQGYVEQLFNNGDQEGMLEDYGDNTLKYIGYIKAKKYIDHLRPIFDYAAENYESLLSES